MLAAESEAKRAAARRVEAFEAPYTPEERTRFLAEGSNRQATARRARYLQERQSSEPVEGMVVGTAATTVAKTKDVVWQTHPFSFGI